MNEKIPLDHPQPQTALKTNNKKCSVLGSRLQDLNVAYHDVLVEFQQLNIELEQSQNQYQTQKELCDSHNCTSSTYFKSTIANKDRMLQQIATTLKEFGETKNYNIIKELLKLLCDKTETLTPPNDDPEQQTATKQNTSNMSESDVEQDASVSEIDGTPGRTSPVLHSKKPKNKTVDSVVGEKKKPCGSWLSPDTKLIKLDRTPRRALPAPARPRARPRQTRLVTATRGARSQLVDLTCSPELSIKKETLEGDDTILPSPTSNVFQPITPDSLTSPFKPPPPRDARRDRAADMDESINLLKPYKLPTNSPRKLSLSRKSNNNENAPAILDPIDKDETGIDKVETGRDNVSLSILRRAGGKLKSPKKEPLSEIMNAENTSPTYTEAAADRKWSPPQPNTPVCAPAPRRRADKRALPGWSCDECRIFYDELYAGNEPMLRRLMEACSRHRVAPRPRTPPGYWRPRWSVPADTDEFNRMNGAE